MCPLSQVLPAVLHSTIPLKLKGRQWRTKGEYAEASDLILGSILYYSTLCSCPGNLPDNRSSVGLVLSFVLLLLGVRAFCRVLRTLRSFDPSGTIFRLFIFVPLLPPSRLAPFLLVGLPRPPRIPILSERSDALPQ